MWWCVLSAVCVEGVNRGREACEPVRTRVVVLVTVVPDT